MEPFLLNIATKLASGLLVAGAGRLRDWALGDAQQRALEDIFRRASAAMLAEMARGEPVDGNRELLALLEEQLASFFRDPEVADSFVEVALLASKPPPVDRLRERFEELGFDPDTFSVSFERAMAVFSLRIAEFIRAEASLHDSPLSNLVEVAKLEELERMSVKLLRRAEPTGPSADELERESWARCRRRWTLLGVPHEEAEALARNRMVGAPGPGLRAKLGRPVVVISAEVGSGKSLLLDRLMQRAIVRYREREDAPLPVFVEAARVENGLREAVVERTSSLGGRPEERGAAVFLDGLDEVDRARARRLLDDAHYLPDRWPNTTVVVAGRPMQELEEEKERGEAFALPEITEDETEGLIHRFSGDNRVLGAIAHGWPASVREAVRRPLFATLAALDMRNRVDGRNPRSIGELLSHLVERALEKSDGAVDLMELRDLAVAITDSGAGHVRAADAGTRAEVQRLRGTGLVHEQGGTLRFSLQILSEWFAAQALELREVDAEDLASDFARLERWRYPLVMAVGNFGHERVMEIFEPVVRCAPAFASRVVDAALAKRRGRIQDGAREDVEEVARRLRRTMDAWVEGLGPLAPLFAPVRGDGSLGTLAISNWFEGRGYYAWYAGPVRLPEVVPYSRVADTNLDIGARHGAFGIERQAAWAWRTTFEDLRSDLEKALKAGKLPALTPMLAREAAWRTAKDLLLRMRGRSPSESRPVLLDEIEGCLEELDAWDEDWISMIPPGVAASATCTMRSDTSSRRCAA